MGKGPALLPKKSYNGISVPDKVRMVKTAVSDRKGEKNDKDQNKVCTQSHG